MSRHNRITAYIHMDAIRHNFQVMKGNLLEGVKMVAVIKTDGYGHGAVPIAQMLEPYDYIWGYAVAAVSEARQLREAGLFKPILVLGYTFSEDYVWMAENGVRPTIFTAEMARQFAEAAETASAQVPAADASACTSFCTHDGKESKYSADECRHFPVHLAVDTGMSRIGVADTPEGLNTALEIAHTKTLTLEGVFTHFARADETDKSAALDQMTRFAAFCDRLEENGVHGFLRHCSNSAGILELPEANMDMVRAGITVYGIYPSEEMDREKNRLHPVMELKSHVVYVKTIPAGTPVSYGGTFVTEHETEVATIPVGYGDGYPRSLSNKGSVLIHGKRARILGRVCMDQFMVDVTGMGVQVLDEVTLMGKDGDDEITVDELGALSGRFPYEFVCDVGKRVPRVYCE
ncbi:MAG: alanine racemase [Lachnospiraceae bacterium]|nr:alanine racemase [Lachnospiraceae bacterium]